MLTDPFVWDARRLHPLDQAWIDQLDHDLERAQAMLRVPLEQRPWPNGAASSELGAVSEPTAAASSNRGVPKISAEEAAAGTGTRLVGAYARRLAALRSSPTTGEGDS